MILLLSIEVHMMCVCLCECVWWGGCVCSTEWVRGQKITSVDSHEFYLAEVWCRASFGITVFANRVFGDSNVFASHLGVAHFHKQPPHLYLGQAIQT